jgi:synaptobrevin family protein YKT6
LMKLLAIAVLKNLGEEKTPISLAKAEDLYCFNYFARSTIREHLAFAVRTVAQRTKPGFRQTVGLKDIEFVCHVHVRQNGLCGLVVADEEYPVRVAFSLITDTLGKFADKYPRWAETKSDQSETPEFMTEALEKFQNPKEADKVLKIQQTVEEIKTIMHRNIDDILKRGETLDALMEKSNDLSATSVDFFKTAKKQNQCCKAY